VEIAVEEAEGFYQRAFRINPLVSQEVLSMRTTSTTRTSTISPVLPHRRTICISHDDGLRLGRFNGRISASSELAQVRFQEAGNPSAFRFLLWYRALAAAHAIGGQRE